MLTELKLGKVDKDGKDRGDVSSSAFQRKNGKKAISVLGGGSSSLPLEKPALEIEKSILSVSLNPTVTQEQGGDKV